MPAIHLPSTCVTAVAAAVKEVEVFSAVDRRLGAVCSHRPACECVRIIQPCPEGATAGLVEQLQGPSCPQTKLAAEHIRGAEVLVWTLA